MCTGCQLSVVSCWWYINAADDYRLKMVFVESPGCLQPGSKAMAILHYTDSDPGSKKRPLVFVHGFPLDNGIWDGQLELADIARVITLDLRGFGKSKSTEPFTIEALADDVHDLLTKINALPCVLAGLSMGGYVSQAYAKKYPGDLSGLILIDTKPEADTEPGKEARNKMIELVRAKGSPAVADQMEPKMLCAFTVQQRPQIVQKLRQIMEACAPLTIEHACAAMRDRPDFTANLRNLKIPVLILIGESDAIIPLATAESMQKATPRCTLAVIKNTGHMAPMEDPPQANNAIRSWWKGAFSK
jgi:3-oxoadipate enol-lactonase